MNQFVPPMPAPQQAATMPPMPGTETAPVAGDSRKVEEWILANCERDIIDGVQACQQFWASCSVAEQIYLQQDQQSGSPLSKKHIGDVVRVRETSNQVDVVTANYTKAVFIRKDVYAVEANGGEVKLRADAMKCVMDSELERTNWRNALRKGIKRFVKFPMACMRAGFSEKDNGDREYWVRSIDPRQILLSDVTFSMEDMHKSPCIAQVHYMTKLDMKRMGMKNLDQLGTADGNQKLTIQPGNETPTKQMASINASTNNPRWEVFEPWRVFDWEDGLEKNAFSLDDLIAFAQKFNIQVQDFAALQNWCVFMTRGNTKQVLSCSPTYLPDPFDKPFRFASFIEAEFGPGQSFLEIIADLGRSLMEMYNAQRDNALARQYQSALINTFGPVDKKKFEELLSKPNTFIPVEFNGLLKDMILFSSDIIPDLSQSTMMQINVAKGMIGTYGASDVIQGQGPNSDTATMASMNNARGQDKIDEPLQRFVELQLVPCLEIIRDLIFMYYNKAMYVRAAGELGATLSRDQLIDPGMLTNRFRVVALTDFEFSKRGQRSQSLLAAMNILSRAPTDPTLNRIFGLFMTMNGWGMQEALEITGNFGQETTPEEEIETMIYNPFERIRVMPGDDHMRCLMVASNAVGQNTQLAQQPNFNEYVQAHMQYAQVQQQQMMMQQAMAAAPGGPGQAQGATGGPSGQNIPRPPQSPPASGGSDDTAQARAQAQNNSAPDQGPQIAGGMTGMGAMG